MWWGINNSKNRTGLDKEQVTVKFKSIFPDYKSWKESLLLFGVKEVDITEEDYNMLSGMIGNAYMKYTTDNKVKSYTSFKFKEFKGIQKREATLYNKSLDEIVATDSTNEQALYTIGRRLDTGIINADYLDNKVISKLNSKEPMINKMDALMKFNKMKAPELMFLIRLANAILLPLQPNQKGDIY